MSLAHCNTQALESIDGWAAVFNHSLKERCTEFRFLTCA